MGVLVTSSRRPVEPGVAEQDDPVAVPLRRAGRDRRRRAVRVRPGRMAAPGAQHPSAAGVDDDAKPDRVLAPGRGGEASRSARPIAAAARGPASRRR